LGIQTFCDDSGGKGQGRWMVFAALLGEAEAFAALADDWDRELRFRHPGAIRYFKMDEAMGLKGEFRHWRKDHRDEKVQRLAQLLNRDTLTEIVAIIDVRGHANVSRELGVAGKHPFSEPYMLAFGQILMGAAAEALARGATGPIEMFFDNHDVFQPIYQRLYPLMRAHLDSPQHQAVLPAQPWFRDDHEFVVLQAADMVAGQVRLTGEQRAPSWMLEMCPKLRVSGFSHIFREEEIRGLLADLGRSAREQGIDLDDPDR
jgi:hypothetical protein